MDILSSWWMVCSMNHVFHSSWGAIPLSQRTNSHYQFDIDMRLLKDHLHELDCHFSFKFDDSFGSNRCTFEATSSFFISIWSQYFVTLLPPRVHSLSVMLLISFLCFFADSLVFKFFANNFLFRSIAFDMLLLADTRARRTRASIALCTSWT